MKQVPRCCKRSVAKLSTSDCTKIIKPNKYQMAIISIHFCSEPHLSLAMKNL